LYTVFISSPKNMARLEDFRGAWAKLADPRKTTADEAQKIAAATPVLVWLGYNVHGNEACSSEAAMQVAYELAASQDERVLNWLDNAVIVIDPVANPDGRDRYVEFYRQTAGMNPRTDRFAAEHQERWPGGRVNHYLFDLNRDWAWLSQQETIARVAANLKWNPQVEVDFHEMGSSSTYFFFPPTKPVLPTIDPLLSKWFEIYGKGNAAAFDKYGFRYYTRESFDFFYPSYGDIWPALNGAVGMTYEQAGGGFAGLAVDLPENQRTVTLRDRVSHHYIASLSTIDTSVKNREARLRDYYAFKQAAVQSGQQGPIKQFFLVPGRDPQRLAHVVEILTRQGIEVQRADAAFDAEDLTSYRGEKLVRKHLPAGTYVVDLAQPAGFLARVLLERETPSPKDSVFFYDVSGWSLPLAMDVEAYAAGKPVRGDFKPEKEVAPVAGTLSGPQDAAAYVVGWEQSAAVTLLSHALQGDIRAYVSLKPFKVAGQQFTAGSIIFPRESNPPDLRERLSKLAEQDHCPVVALPTLLSDQGIDLGSGRVRFLRKPRIAMLMDTPVSATEYGALWFLFEQRVDIPFTPIRTESLREVNLDDYNVLILPPDYDEGHGYSRYIDKGGMEKLKQWVREGGVLIGLRGGALLATKQSGLASIGYHFIKAEDEQARIEQEKAGEKPDDKAAPAAPEKPADVEKQKQELDRKLMRWADREQVQRTEDVPGTIVRAMLDTTHPLGFGLEDEIPVMSDTAPLLELTGKGENVAYFPKDNIKLSGYLTPENEKKMAQTAYLVRERQGRGFVILFADTPVFRGFWDGSTRLLLNAVFFGNITDPNIH
jgi:hypothetical protein